MDAGAHGRAWRRVGAWARACGRAEESPEALRAEDPSAVRSRAIHLIVLVAGVAFLLANAFVVVRREGLSLRQDLPRIGA